MAAMPEARHQAALLGCTRALAHSSTCPLGNIPVQQRHYARAQADRSACIHRFHDSSLHRRLAPENPGADTAFQQIEWLRCQLLGSRLYPGIAVSLDEFHSRQHAISPAQQLVKMLWQQLHEPDDKFSPSWLSQADSAALVARLEEQQQFAVYLLPRLDTWLQSITPLRGVDSEAVADLVDSSDDDPATSDSPSIEVESSAAEEPLGETESGFRHPLFRSMSQDYQIFSRTQDRIVYPGRLMGVSQFQQLKVEFERILPDQQRVVKKLARRLQRHIMALQQRHWQFNLDEGILDPARLTRVVTHPGNPLACKLEQEGKFPSTAVTLLLDNSGSMRGLPSLHAALCIDVLMKTLEQCGVTTEVLGYTTTGWKESSLKPWTAAGKPDRPGRLNGLQHLIFKAANERWRRSQHSLGWLLQHEQMRENIDGEALQWAAGRLLSLPEKRKILIVLADGAPHDEATHAANGRGFLEQHLQQVSEQLECHSVIELLGIGLGQDMSRYYSRSAVIHHAEQLGGVLIGELDALLADTDAGNITP